MQIIFNPDRAVVEQVKHGLEENGGYCPCRTEKTEDTKCMCTEFRLQTADPGFHGFCRCGLYCVSE